MTQATVSDGTLTQALLQYRRMLCGFIYSAVRDVIVTEEIFQQVALVAIEKDRRGDEVIREPARWLRETARRLVQAGFRTSQGRLITVDAEYLECIADVYEANTGRDYQVTRLAALDGCMKRVSADNRDLLHQHYVQGKTYAEIGADVNRTPAALRVLVHRIVRQLAGCIEGRLATES
jgi:RNA polymerase sigma factor (sigma-70 family)